MTTLRDSPLRFIIKKQEIFLNNGELFKHPIKKQVWDMVLKCNRLGDGRKVTVQVPFDAVKGTFGWGLENAGLIEATL
jgi:hypothetical protein